MICIREASSLKDYQLLLVPVSELFQSSTEAEWPYDPQLAVGASITASLVIKVAVEIIKGNKVRVAPNVIQFDSEGLIIQK